MISICVPTRGRPDRFEKMVESALATADGDVEIVARLDEDDPSAGAYPRLEHVVYIRGSRPRMMSSLWNECWVRATGDIGMLAGDDIIFETKGWDTRVVEAMRSASDRLVMVYTNDQTPRQAPVLPFISRRWADLVGFTTNDFPGWFADEWIWAIAAELRRVVFLEDVIIHHLQLGDDATYQEAALRRYQMGGIDGLRARFYSPEMVAQRDLLIASLRAEMAEDVELEPIPRPLWFAQSLDWARNARPEPIKVRGKTLVVIHCWEGDRNNVIDFLPYHKRHRLPILLLSPENAPVEIEEPGVTSHSIGLRGYFGQESLERQRLHLEYLLTLPYDYFLLNDADSICIEPSLPDYLYAPENKDIVWSNEVPEFRPHASPYPKIAMQPPYFLHRESIERLLTVDVSAHPITPYIDWYMLALSEESHTTHKSFPDGASFPAWRRNYIEETQKLGHEFRHEYVSDGQIAGDAMMQRRVREGAIFLHSIKHKPVMDMLVAQRDEIAGRRFEPVRRKLTVSVIVPFRPEENDDTRERLWEWIERRWRWMLPDAEIVVGTDDGMPFSKAAAVNDGFLHSKGDILIVSDADTWLEPDRVKKTIAAIDQRQRLVVPWAKVYRFDQDSTESLLRMDPTGPLPLDKLGIERGSPEPITAGTIFGITRRAFETVNGMDPRMRGWGFEDISFRRACDVLIGRTTYLHLGSAYSLWHPAPVIEGKGRVWENDVGQLSTELNTQYLDAESQPMGAMRMLCDEHPLGREAAPVTPRYMRADQSRTEDGRYVIHERGANTQQDGELVVREPIWNQT